MLKLTGAVLLFGACALAGVRYGMRWRRRQEYYEQLDGWLTFLQLEISYSRSSMVELLRQGGKEFPELTFLSGCERRIAEGESFAHALSAAVAETAKELPEFEKGLAIIGELASTLGTTDMEDQQKVLRLAQKKLSLLTAEAREDRKKYEKLYRSLGVLGGLAAILVIL